MLLYDTIFNMHLPKNILIMQVFNRSHYSQAIVIGTCSYTIYYYIELRWYIYYILLYYNNMLIYDYTYIMVICY